MKRLFSVAIAVAAIILPRFGQASDPFEQKLSPDRQIIQALNRLTFGPRPGDVAAALEQPQAAHPGPAQDLAGL